MNVLTEIKLKGVVEDKTGCVLLYDLLITNTKYLTLHVNSTSGNHTTVIVITSVNLRFSMDPNFIFELIPQFSVSRA